MHDFIYARYAYFPLDIYAYYAYNNTCKEDT